MAFVIFRVFFFRFVAIYFCAAFATPSNVKHLTIGDQSHRKIALGDIKNAPMAFEKSPIKNNANADRIQQDKAGPGAIGTSPAKTDAMNAAPDECTESASASSKYVDHSDIWCNNLALSDAEITRWVQMLNSAWSMPMTPPNRPPTPPLFEEIEIPGKTLFHWNLDRVPLVLQYRYSIAILLLLFA